ncbi:unnamed protein product [Coffea canephora]|uniref:CASP-like protein n=2 Tax=Coffea TaxID=13442 RepID=A0A068TUA3_COFCA|nr:CASP-like protein 1C1 [Coffea arabica]CDO99544.1 unnamed protein product [Coffea canephora]
MTLAKRVPIFLLRLLALGASVTAAVVMVSARDSAQVFNMTFEANYTNSPTFKYFVIINAVAGGYTLIVLFCPSKVSLFRFLLVSDLIVTLLLDSSVSANIAIGQVGKHGNSHAGWLPICNQVPKFCNHVAGALIANFVASLAYLVILLYSLHIVLNLPKP